MTRDGHWLVTVSAGGVLIAGLAAALIVSATVGEVSLSLGEVWRTLTGRGAPDHTTIIWEFRLPRAALATLIGGGLALSGATFQALLRNPLAEPYILGVSGGAAVGAISVVALGVAAGSSWALPVAAFGGAILAITLVFAVASSAGRALDVRVLLLAGVVVGAFFTAIMALILSISESDAVYRFVLWTMGSVAGATWRDVAIVAAYTAPCALGLVFFSRSLNLMSIGEETAGYLGTDVERVKKVGYAIASLMTAAGVAFAGVIGFVGLIIPHAVRLVTGSDHRTLLPLSFLAGGAFLALADVVARTALSPVQIPIGVVTALIGVPFFLVLLRWNTRR